MFAGAGDRNAQIGAEGRVAALQIAARRALIVAAAQRAVSKARLGG
jgi:hypothetical protein